MLETHLRQSVFATDASVAENKRQASANVRHALYAWAVSTADERYVGDTGEELDIALFTLWPQLAQNAFTTRKTQLDDILAEIGVELETFKADGTLPIQVKIPATRSD